MYQFIGKKKKLIIALTSILFIVFLIFPNRAQAGWLEDAAKGLSKFYNTVQKVNNTIDKIPILNKVWDTTPGGWGLDIISSNSKLNNDILALFGLGEGNNPELTDSKDSSFDLSGGSTESLAKEIAGSTKFKDIWKTVLNIVDSFIILVLIAIAFANILRIKIDNYAIKKALPTLIIGIVLANFSYVICTMMIEFAGILTDWAKTEIAQTDKIAQAFFVKALLGASETGQSATIVVGDKAGGLAGLFIQTSSFGVIGGFLVGALLFLVMVIVMMILWFLLIIRQYVIIFLLVVSPLAFFALSTANTTKYFQTWWDQFIKWLFIPVASFFVLGLGLRIMDAFSESLLGLGRYIFALGVMIVAIVIPFKMGGTVAAMWGNFGKAITGTGKGGFFDRQSKAVSNKAGEYISGAKRLGKSKLNETLRKDPLTAGMMKKGDEWNALLALTEGTEETMKKEAMKHGTWKYAFGENNEIYNKQIEDDVSSYGRTLAQSVDPEKLETMMNSCLGMTPDQLKQHKKTEPGEVRAYFGALQAMRLIADNKVMASDTAREQAKKFLADNSNPADIYDWDKAHSKPPAMGGSGGSRSGGDYGGGGGGTSAGALFLSQQATARPNEKTSFVSENIPFVPGDKYQKVKVLNDSLKLKLGEKVAIEQSDLNQIINGIDADEDPKKLTEQLTSKYSQIDGSLITSALSSYKDDLNNAHPEIAAKDKEINGVVDWSNRLQGKAIDKEKYANSLNDAYKALEAGESPETINAARKLLTNFTGPTISETGVSVSDIKAQLLKANKAAKIAAELQKQIAGQKLDPIEIKTRQRIIAKQEYEVDSIRNSVMNMEKAITQAIDTPDSIDLQKKIQVNLRNLAEISSNTQISQATINKLSQDVVSSLNKSIKEGLNLDSILYSGDFRKQLTDYFKKNPPKPPQG